MKIYFDEYRQPKQPNVYLGTSNNKILCVLNGIEESTFQIIQNLNNTYELSFDINRYIKICGTDGDTEEIESNAYNLIDVLMRIYVEDIGWFIAKPPTISNTGTNEVKTINAESSEIEMIQHDIVGLKINRGTTDSYEMLIDGNVQMIGEIEFAKEQIKFYNKEKPELSLLNILMKVSGLHGWSIGYIDTIPKEYKYYGDISSIESTLFNLNPGSYIYIDLDDKTIEVYRTESGKYIYTDTSTNTKLSDIEIAKLTTLKNQQLRKQIMLEDEIGSFDIETNNLYAVFTQDVSKYFGCVFIFDFLNFKINAYRPENLGKDTNINIGFRNLEQSNEITVEENNFFTRYNVHGSDDLGISYSNFGSNIIENLNYFLNEKYLNKDLIYKYKLWENDVESNRQTYIENTRKYNEQQAIISELINRVPLDGCSMDWSTFSDEDLLEAQQNYQAQQKGYESFYVDENDEFDKDALNNSSDANDYYQIIDVILPSIQIEINNRNLSPGDELDYIDSYKTKWELYGLDELNVRIKMYENDKKLAESEHCTEPYNEESSGHTKDYHEALYAKYLDAINQLDQNYQNSCMGAHNERKLEIDNAKSFQEQCDDNRTAIARFIDKEFWSHIESNKTYEFTAQDLTDLSKLYVDGTYTNDNMFLTSSDNSVSTIDEQLKLLDAAKEDLDIASQKQYVYSTNLDNFLSKYEYLDYTRYLNVGDFIYLGVREDYVVKLRVVSIKYNPMEMGNDLQITFSNMLKSTAERIDYSYLLDSSSGGNKQNSNGNSSNEYLSNEGITLTAGILQKLLSSGAFSNKVSQIVNNEFAGYVGKTISVNELNAKIIKAADIEGENGFFEYLQSKFISADKIVANSAEFQKILSDIAEIEKIVAGEIKVDRITGTTGEFEEFFVKNLNVTNVFGENAAFKTLIADVVKITNLDVKNIIGDNGSFDNFFVNNFRVNTILGNNGEFNTLVSDLITTDKIVARLADIDQANIDKLFAKNSFTESLAALSASISTATIDKAYITSIVSANMTVGDLQAGDITLSNSMRIISENGKMIMNGNVLQVIGSTSNGEEYVGIQLGYDATNNPSFILRDEFGVLLLTPHGITENAISDGLIVDNMLHTGTISKDKLGFSIVEPNKYGGIDITQVYDGKGNLWGAEYDSFKENVTSGIDKANDLISSVQTHIGSVIDKDSATIKDSVWEKTYLYKPKLDKNGNIQYDDDGNILKEKDAYNIIDRTVEQIINLDGIIKTVGTTDQEGLRKKITTAQQTADKFYWLVEGNSTSSSLTLTENALISISEEVKFMSPDGKSVIIKDGRIQSEAITTSMLSSDAIKSKNYSKDVSSSPFSILGTFLDLNNGAIYTPAFGTDGSTKAYINGEIVAASGRIGETLANSWQIGTVYNTDLEPSAAMIANGDAYIWAGNWTFGVDKINTYNNGDYLIHDNIYYDLGVMVPVLDTTSSEYVNSKVSDNFLYIRKHSNTIPVIENDWEYLFRVDKNGTVFENGIALNKKYASIDGVSGAYLPLKGGTIQNDLSILGNLIVNGTITGIVTKANQLTHTLNVNGKGWNGLSDLNIGTIGVSYGGTGKTSWVSNGIIYATSNSTLGQLPIGTSGYVLRSNGDAAPNWVPQSALTVGIATKSIQDGSGNIITTTYMQKDGGVFTGVVTFNDTLYADDIQASNILVTGEARFTNGIIGDVTGNLAGVAAKATELQNARTFKIGDASKEFDATENITWTIAEIGAASASHTHTKSQISDFPASLKSPYELTLQFNGISQAVYDGSSSKSFNITPLSIGALGVSQNAVSASKLYAARTINGVSFDGTKNIIITADPTSTLLQAEDLNTIKIPGVYYAYGGNTVMNKPGIDAFGLYVLKTAGGYISQLLIEGSKSVGKIWQRQYNGSTWNNWTYLYSQLYKPSKGDVGLGNVDNTADSVKNVLSATKLTTARNMTIGSSTKSINWSSPISFTMSEIGAATSGHVHDDYASKITLNDIICNVSNNNVNITRANLITAIGAASGASDGYMSKVDKVKLDNINISDIGTVGANSIKGSGAIGVAINNGIATISHGNSGVSSGSYGANSTNYYRIPNLTINASGHVTVAGYYDITAANLVSRIGSTAVANATNSINSSIATKSPLLSNLFNTRPSSANLAHTGSGGLVTFKATDAMTTGKPASDGHILHMYWDNTGGYDSQIAIPTRASDSTLSMQYRGQDTGVWGEWKTLLDSKNFAKYTVTKTGTGASGTWPISITGSAVTASNANSANKATQDSSGQQINTTYIKSLSSSGSTITYTKGNGVTATITLPDTNTTYVAGAGLSLNGTMFNHKNNVVAGTAQGDAAKTLGWNGTFTVPTVSYDAQGHITGKGTTTMTMPSNPNTWRGIQNILTSTSISDSLSAYQGKLLNDKFANYLLLHGNADTATRATQDASGNTITTKYVSIDIAQNISGVKTITNTTASTSKTTGAFKVKGGVGVEGQMSANKIMVDNGTEKCTLEMDEYGALNFIFS